MELYPEDDQELYSYMSYEERKMHERLIEYALERILIKDIKFMASLGASAEQISEGINYPLDKVKKILETEWHLLIKKSVVYSAMLITLHGTFDKKWFQNYSSHSKKN